MLDARCWMLEARGWMLDVGGWRLDVGGYPDQIHQISLQWLCCWELNLQFNEMSIHQIRNRQITNQFAVEFRFRKRPHLQIFKLSHPDSYRDQITNSLNHQITEIECVKIL